MVKKIAYVSWGREENVVNRLNKWIQNGHDINNSFIKIVHNGAFYAVFYDADLDNPVKELFIMTDNFKLYRDFIAEKFAKTTLLTIDSYFVVELMRRGKDNPDMPAVNYHFKNYYIRKPEDLDKYENEIKTLCEVLRLRAYASVNIKSFKQGCFDDEEVDIKKNHLTLLYENL